MDIKEEIFNITHSQYLEPFIKISDDEVQSFVMDKPTLFASGSGSLEEASKEAINNSKIRDMQNFLILIIANKNITFDDICKVNSIIENNCGYANPLIKNAVYYDELVEDDNIIIKIYANMN